MKRIIVENGKRTEIDICPLITLLHKARLDNCIIRVCGAHDALSATIAQRAGFDAVWLSSFEAHAINRLPDADILTVSDYAYMCNRMADRIEIPILVDGDAGGGSPINTIRMVREYEKNGASGICIEDNLYPKRCSFYEGVKRGMTPMKEHCKKIQAACEHRTSKNFLIMARTETLIQGGSIGEALERCMTYVGAGAEAVLIHHKGSDPDDVLTFAEEFHREFGRGKTPVVCVPTTYGQVTEQKLRDAGIFMVIYANMMLRASIEAMKAAAGLVIKHGRLTEAELILAPMQEVYDLVGVQELQENEIRYSTND